MEIERCEVVCTIFFFYLDLSKLGMKTKKLFADRHYHDFGVRDGNHKVMEINDKFMKYKNFPFPY